MELVQREVRDDWLYLNLRPEGMYVSRSTRAAREQDLGCGDMVVVDDLSQTTLLHVEYCQLTPEALVKWCSEQGLSRREFEILYLISPRESAALFGC
jgi:hypothetical protein